MKPRMFCDGGGGFGCGFSGDLKIFGRWDLENDWRFLFDRITDDVEKLKGLGGGV